MKISISCVAKRNQLCRFHVEKGEVFLVSKKERMQERVLSFRCQEGASLATSRQSLLAHPGHIIQIFQRKLNFLLRSINVIHMYIPGSFLGLFIGYKHSNLMIWNASLKKL